MSQQPQAKRRRLTDGKESKTESKEKTKKAPVAGQESKTKPLVAGGLLLRLAHFAGLYPMMLGYLGHQEWMRLRRVHRVLEAADLDSATSLVRSKHWQRALDLVNEAALKTANSSFGILPDFCGGCPMKSLKWAVAVGRQMRKQLTPDLLTTPPTAPLVTEALHPCTHCSSLLKNDKNGALGIVVPLVPFPACTLNQVKFILAEAWLCKECCLRPTYQTCGEIEARRLGYTPTIQRVKSVAMYGGNRIYLVRDVRQPKTGRTKIGH